MTRKLILTQWLRIVVGLFVFAFGVHLTILANIGLAPWDCLGMGISMHTPLNYGLSMTVMGVVILLIDLLLKEKIGWGTVIDALLTGNFVELFNRIDPLPKNEKIWSGVLIILAGLAIMAIGQFLYMRGAQGCGPRDSLLIGVGKRLKRIPIGFVEIGLWAVVLAAGWALGGPVGIGTLVCTFGAGAVMHVIYSIIRFEPREIRHRDIVEVTRALVRSEK